MNSKWLTTFFPVDRAKLQLFCFHYAGGSSNIFRTWQNHMPDDIQIVGVELPGHGKRLSEQCKTDLLDLVQDIAAELNEYLDLPFAFFGHSMGALLSFELTRLLRKFSRPLPQHLFLSAHKAPHLPRDSEPIYDLPEDEFVRRLYELNGTPKAVLENDELRELFLPLLRSDFQVCETYDFKDSLPIHVPISVFGGRQDAEISFESLRAWQKHTTAPFQVHSCDGDHFFINNADTLLFPTLIPQLSALVSQDEAQIVTY